MELERLSRIAKSVKFDGFKMHFRQYIASLKSAEEPTSEAEDQPYSAFDDQPLELFTGDWRTDNTGVWHYQGNGKEYACSHPIMPVQILKSVDTRRYKVKLIFRRGGNRSKKPWDEAIIGLEDLSSPSEIVKALAPYGVSVTGGKRAYALVDYLRDVMDWNVNTIPEIRSVSRMGWNDEGFYPYTSGKEVAFDSASTFLPIYNAIKQVGTFDGWLKAALDARSFSLTARIVLAASFAAPLVEPLGVLPFFVHLWGGSGNGKTVSQMVAASVWAYPVKGGPFFPTFDSTDVGFEVIAGFLHSFPLFIEELEQAKKDGRGNTKFSVYNLTSGSGRLRSNRNLGLNYTPTWNNCFITSGEHPIVSDTDGEGALNRVFEIECYHGVKVIRDGHWTAEQTKANYGHAGKMFIEILTEDGCIDRARAVYEDFYKILLENDTTEKQAMAAAAILTADALATEWIFKDGRALTVAEISEFLKSKETVSLMDRGYQIVCDWVAMNAKMLQGLDAEDANRVCYGVVDNGTAYIIRGAFNQVCKDNDIDSKALLSHLKTAGLIETGKKGYTKTYYIGGGQSPNCVWLKLPKSEEENREIDETDIL